MSSTGRTYNQAQVNWLLKKAYKAGWQDGRGAEDDWFLATAENSWFSSLVKRWCLDKARRPTTARN